MLYIQRSPNDYEKDIKMIVPSNFKKLLVLMCLSLFVILAGKPASHFIDGNVALAQQVPSANPAISIPPQQSTNVLSSSPGSSVRPPASQKWGAPATLPTTVLPQESCLLYTSDAADE